MAFSLSNECICDMLEMHSISGGSLKKKLNYFDYCGLGVLTKMHICFDQHAIKNFIEEID